jgi:hypothetical protein
MAQSFLKVLTPQKSTTNTASSSTNAQVTTSLDPLSCAFCGQSGHFIAQYLICANYITNEKCKRKYKRNPDGRIILPNGQFTLCSIPGQFIKGRIDKWHKCNPSTFASSSLMYEIHPVVTSSQTSFSTNMVLTSSTNVFIADQRIATLEQEIFNLRNAKRTFDGVEILKPARANKPVPTEQPKVPESTTKSTPPPSQPAPAEKAAATTQPPIHLFANVKEMTYQPPHECNFATAPTKPAKDTEPAYHYVAPVQNPPVANMKSVLHKELNAKGAADGSRRCWGCSLPLSPWCSQGLHNQKINVKQFNAYIIILIHKQAMKAFPHPWPSLPDFVHEQSSNSTLVKCVGPTSS